MTCSVKGPPCAPEGYRPSGLDEAFDHDGRPRALYPALLASLASVDLADLARRVGEQVSGVTFGGGADARRFRIDPVPRLIGGEEWERLERGLVQRTRALAAFVADVYGERAIVAAGVVPARVIDSAECFESSLVGIEGPAAAYVAGLDLVRDADGLLRVLEDNIRTPSGIAYLLAAREGLDAQLGVPAPAGRLEPSGAIDLLGAALRAAAPADVDEPCVVLLSDGPGNTAWYEHRRIAATLGVPLVLPGDLSLRAGRLWAETGGPGPEPVDVVYRRTDVDRLRNAHGAPTWVADCLLDPVRNGSLAVVNPFGCGVADDKAVHAYVEEMVRFYLGEEPAIASVPTYDLGEPDVRDAVLHRLDELVVKPRDGLGGEGIVVCPHASAADREQIARRVVEAPDRWVAQEMVSISTHPTVCERGRLEPRHVDLRPFVVGGAAEAAAVPGALTRVAFGAGSLVVNSSQNGGAKDTWVLAP